LRDSLRPKNPAAPKRAAVTIINAVKILERHPQIGRPADGMDDLAFREELVQKTRILRTSILGWFAAHSLSEINKLGEAGVKRELLVVINANLVLGRIEILYFDDFMVLG